MHGNMSSMNQLFTLCGRTEYSRMNPRVGARMIRALLSIKLPSRTNTKLPVRARGNAENRYHMYGDVWDAGLRNKMMRKKKCRSLQTRNNGSFWLCLTLNTTKS